MILIAFTVKARESLCMSALLKSYFGRSEWALLICSAPSLSCVVWTAQKLYQHVDKCVREHEIHSVSFSTTKKKIIIGWLARQNQFRVFFPTKILCKIGLSVGARMSQRRKSGISLILELKAESQNAIEQNVHKFRLMLAAFNRYRFHKVEKHPLKVLSSQ